MYQEEEELLAEGQQRNNGSHGASLHPRLAWMICYEETGSAQDVCRKFGISRKTFYKWLKRYKQAKGNTGALADQSRRPHHFPNGTPESSIQLLKRVKDQTGYGQRRLKQYLEEKHNIRISERTIWKLLKRIEDAEMVIQPEATGSSLQPPALY